MDDGDDVEQQGASAPAAGEGAISVIAVPLAGSKLAKRLYKVCKKAAASKMLKRGVKEVVKALRKGEKGCVGVRAAAAERCAVRLHTMAVAAV